MGSSSSSSSSSSWLSKFCSSALRVKTLTAYSSEAYISTASGEGLLRRLGLFDLILLAIGATIGAGIFAITGAVAHDVGPGVTVSYVLAGLVSALNAFCFSELASRFPAVVGGAYMYAYTAFNELTAFLVFTQLMFDGHIGAASIARSLASYLMTTLEVFPFFKENVPSWIGHGGKEFFGGFVSINILAPIIIALLTIVLCRGIGELSVLNFFMTTTKIVIVLLVIIIGAFEVDVSNWSPFAPNGFNAIVTGATVVFFSYLGSEVVTSSAEECKRPQRDLPIAIVGSFLICATLYISVCLVITGMVSYKLLGDDAPLATAFELKGLKYVSIFVSIGAIAGLTTTLLVVLYVHSRFYLGLGRDGLLPSVFAKVHQTRRTPVFSQIWAGLIAGILAGLFNVHLLSHILSVGALTGYSVVSACVVTLRWEETEVSEVSTKKWISTWLEGVLCLITIACCGFGAGLCFRFGASFVLYLVTVMIAVIAVVALYYRQVYVDPPGFSCPVVPFFPVSCIFFNIFLFAQLHNEAWLRFVVLIIVSVGIYAFYGQYHAHPGISNQIIIYDQPAIKEALITNHAHDNIDAT